MAFVYINCANICEWKYVSIQCVWSSQTKRKGA